MKGREEMMSRRLPVPLWVLCGLFLVFSILPVTAFARETGVLIPSFGTGGVQVRLYTDYFCAPCSRMEPRIEGLITELVRKNTITLTFIDTPVHSFTPLYAKYFLYILRKERGFSSVLRARDILFEAARNKIEQREGLEEFLKKNKVGHKEFDAKPTLAALEAMIKEDDVKSTPTCVVVKDGRKSVFTGDIDIPKALELLR
jgi:hypothetical protein